LRNVKQQERETTNLEVLHRSSKWGLAVPIQISNPSTVLDTANTANVHAVSGFLSTKGNQIVDDHGQPVRISAVDWFGMDGLTLAPNGLWARNYQDMMTQMKDQGFNTIRLGISGDTLNPNLMPTSINTLLNPDLVGLNAMQLLDKVVAEAGVLGMRVILDYHRVTAGYGPQDTGLWYTAGHPEQEWINNWKTLAGHFAHNPTVIGADLFNEPQAHWAEYGVAGNTSANDWHRAATAAGDAIQSVNPDWLVFVQGVWHYKNDWYWLGGNHQGVKDAPVTLDVANKLVYSVHDYPPSIYPASFFDNMTEASLKALWDKNWGYIYKENIAPVWVGEFGSKYETAKDFQWLSAFYKYLQGDFNNDGIPGLKAGDQGISWSYWSWNPNSHDTGGILADDWRTVNTQKVADLRAVEGQLLPTTDSAYTHAIAGTVDFKITLPKGAVGNEVYLWRTVDGTAKDGKEYFGGEGLVHFSDGMTSTTVKIALADLHNGHAPEQFSFQLVDYWTKQVITTSTATVIDGDPAPTTTIVVPVAKPAVVAQPELHATFTAKSAYNGHFYGEVTIKNTGNADLKVIDFDLRADGIIIDKTYNIANSTTGTDVKLGAAYDGQMIKAGESLTFGVSAHDDGTPALKATGFHYSKNQTGPVVNDMSAAKVDFVVKHHYGDHVSGSIVVTNTRDHTLANWTLDVDSNIDLANVYNGLSQKTATDKFSMHGLWSGATLEKGQSVEIAFVGEAHHAETLAGHLHLNYHGTDILMNI
jgi:endoglucanase